MPAVLIPARILVALGVWLALAGTPQAQLATPPWGADVEAVVEEAGPSAGLNEIYATGVAGAHLYLLAQALDPGDGLSLTASYGFGAETGALEVVVLYLDAGDPAVLLDRLENVYGTGVTSKGPELAGSAVIHVVRFADLAGRTLITFDLKGDDCYVIYRPLPDG